MPFPKFEPKRNRELQEPSATSATPATLSEQEENGPAALADPSLESSESVKTSATKTGAAAVRIARAFPEFSKPVNRPGAAFVPADVQEETKPLGAPGGANVADVAGAFAENWKILEPASEPDNDADLPRYWRECTRSLDPHCERGQRIKAAALAFLDSDLVYEAIEHDWNELQLFGVMRTDDAAILERRADCKGVMTYVSLAPLEGYETGRLQRRPCPNRDRLRCDPSSVKKSFERLGNRAVLAIASFAMI